MKNDQLNKTFELQKEFQRAVGFPIDSMAEADRNELSEKYIFKLIEEAIELRKEFPSAINPWSKKQKSADIERIQEEFSDVILFLINIAIVWGFSPGDILRMVQKTQINNFQKLKEKKMAILNSDILKIPNRISGIGSGSLSPKIVFIGQNPGKDITHGYRFWSNPEDGSSKVLLPTLERCGINREDCYFTNIVKCTTPENEKPSEELTKFYKEFLDREIEILKMGNPEIKVITLGLWAEQNYKHDGSIKHPATVLYGGLTSDQYETHLRAVLA